MSTLNLFPSRVPIGQVTLPDGTELKALASMEFLKALKILFERVGGATGIGSGELAELIMQLLMRDSPQPAQAEYVEPVLNYGPQLAVMAGMFEELQALRGDNQMAAEMAALRQQVEQLAQLVSAPAQAPSYSDFLHGYAEPQAGTDWEHPGKIGARTANSGSFTTLSSSGAAALNSVASTTSISGVTLTITGATGTVPAKITAGTGAWALQLLGRAADNLAYLELLPNSGSGSYGGAIYSDGATKLVIASQDSNDCATFQDAGVKIAKAFGCNGKAAQTAAVSGGTLAGVITALVANGILSS